MEKLKDAKKIKWKEIYTDKTHFLKNQFDAVVGKGSYRRWEGTEVGGPGEWYVVVSPADVHEHKRAKFFAGVRKMPDSYPAGGKYFDTIREAYEYAFSTWGTPRPKDIPHYTAGDLKGISKKIDDWKARQEELEAQSSFKFDVFRIRNAMAQAATFKDLLAFDLTPFIPLIEEILVGKQAETLKEIFTVLNSDDVSDSLYLKILNRAGYSNQEDVSSVLTREADQNKALAYTTLPGGQRKEWLDENRALARQRGTEGDRVPKSGGEQFFQIAAKVCTIGRMKRKRLMDEFVSQVGSFDKSAIEGIGPKFYRSNFEESILSDYSQYVKNQKRIKEIYDFTYYAYESYMKPRDLVLERKIEKGQISDKQAKLGRLRVSVLDQLSKKYDAKRVSEAEKIKIEREIANIENLFAYEVMSDEDLLKQGLIKREDGLYTKEGNYKKFDRISFEDAVKRMEVYLDQSFNLNLTYDEFRAKLQDPQFAEKYEIRDSEIPLKTMVTYGRRDSACGYWISGPYFSEKPYKSRYYFSDETFSERDEFGFNQLDYAFLDSENVTKRPGPEGNDILASSVEDKIGRGGRFTYKYEPVSAEEARAIAEEYKDISAKIEDYIRNGQIVGSNTKRTSLFEQNLKTKDFNRALNYIDINFLKDLDMQKRSAIKKALRSYLMGWGISVKGETQRDPEFDANLQGRLYGAMYLGQKAIADKVAPRSLAEVIMRESTHLYKYSAPASSLATVLLQFKSFSALAADRKASIETLESKLAEMGDREVKMEEFIGMVADARLQDILSRKDILYIYGDAAKAGSTIPLFKVQEGGGRAQPLYELLGKDMNNLAKKTKANVAASGKATDYQQAILQYFDRKGWKDVQKTLASAKEEALSRLTLTRILKGQVETINGKQVRVLTDDYVDDFLDRQRATYVSKFNYKDNLEPGDIRPVLFTNKDGVELGMLGLSDYAYYKMMKKKFKDLWGLAEANPKLYEDILRCYFIPESLRDKVQQIGVPTFVSKTNGERMTTDEQGNYLVLKKGRIFAVTQNRKGESILKPVPAGLYTAVVSASPEQNVATIESLLEQFFGEAENMAAYKLLDTFSSGYSPYNNEHPDLVRKSFKRDEEETFDMRAKLEVLSAIQESVLTSLAKDVVKAYESGDQSFTELFPGMKPKEEMDETQKEIMQKLIFATNPTVACSTFIATINSDYMRFKPDPADLVTRTGRPKKAKKKNYIFPEISEKIENGDQSYSNFVTAMGQDPNRKLYVEDFIDIAQKIGLEVSEEEIREVFVKAGSGVKKAAIYDEFSKALKTVSSSYGVSSPYRIDNFSAPYGTQQTMSEIIGKVTSTLGYSAFLSDKTPLTVRVSDNAANFALITNSSFANHCETSSMVEGAPEDIALDDDYVRDNSKQCGMRSRDLAIALRLGTEQGMENLSQVSTTFSYATAFKTDLYRMIREASSRRSGSSPVALDPFVSFTPGGEEMVVWYEAVKDSKWGDIPIVITANLVTTWIHVGLPGVKDTLTPQQLSEILGVSISSIPKEGEEAGGFGEIEKLFEAGREAGQSIGEINKGMSADRVDKKRTEIDDNQESGDEETTVSAVDKPAQDKAKEDAKEQAKVVPETPAEVPSETPAEVPPETTATPGLTPGVTPEAPPQITPGVAPETGPKKIRTIKRPGQAPTTTPTGQPLDEKVQAPPPASAPAPTPTPIPAPVQSPSKVPSAPKKVYKIKKAFGPTQKNESYDKTSLLSLIRVAKVFNNRGEYLKAEAINSFVREALDGNNADKNRRIAVVKTLSDLVSVSKDLTKRGKIEDADEINKIVEKHLGAINKI